MQPLLKPGQIVWVFNWAYLFSSPKVGEIVVARLRGRNLVKRIGANLEGKLKLVGDNQHDSWDSNQLGTVTRKDIIGKVLFPKQKGAE
jgi:signal peptidase I